MSRVKVEATVEHAGKQYDYTIIHLLIIYFNKQHNSVSREEPWIDGSIRAKLKAHDPMSQESQKDHQGQQPPEPYVVLGTIKGHT